MNTYRIGKFQIKRAWLIRKFASLLSLRDL